MPETTPLTEAEADAKMEAEAEALIEAFLTGLRRIKADKAENRG